MAVVAIGSLMTVVALPIISTTMSNVHLSAAASSLSGAAQSSRYQAISSGCGILLTVSAQSYQLTSAAGNPPACSAFTPLPTSLIPYTSTEISLTAVSVNGGAAVAINTSNPTAAFQLNPSGMVTATSTTVPPTNYTFILSQSKGAATKQVNVSGMGYVTVHSCPTNSVC